MGRALSACEAISRRFKNRLKSSAFKASDLNDFYGSARIWTGDTTVFSRVLSQAELPTLKIV